MPQICERVANVRIMRRKTVFCANKAIPHGRIEVVRPKCLAMFDADGDSQIRRRAWPVAQCDKQLFNWVGYWYGTGTVLVRYWVAYWYDNRVGGIQLAHGPVGPRNAVDLHSLRRERHDDRLGLAVGLVVNGVGKRLFDGGIRIVPMAFGLGASGHLEHLFHEHVVLDVRQGLL